jgi:hypothetical protein
MVGFTVKTWNGSTVAPALATESEAIFYKLRSSIGKPAEAWVTLNDPDFASTQKYAVTGANAYLGLGKTGAQPKGQIQIEEPTGTKVFDGVIVGVRARPRSGTLELHCKDWLHQLEAQEVSYDTREDLDGAGLRESIPFRVDTTNTKTEHVVKEGGVEHWYLYDTENGGWGDDAFNGVGEYYYLVFSHKMAGDQSFWLPAMDTENEQGTEANDFVDTVYDDTSYHEVVSAVNGEDTIMTYVFKTEVPEAKIDRIDLEVRYNFSNDGGPPVLFWCDIYDASDADWGPDHLFLYDHSYMQETTVHERAFKDITSRITSCTVAKVVDGDGKIKLRFTSRPAAGTKDTVWYYYVRLIIHTKAVVGNSTAYLIADTDGTDKWIHTENDLSHDGGAICKHSPYSVSQQILIYAKDIVDTYDTVKTIDTSTDTTDDNDDVCARHFHYMYPIDMLRYLADADGTTFWLDVDLHLHWNDPYTTGATTVTDADVLYWVDPEITVKELANSLRVLGMRYSTGQVSYTTTDAGSITNYGTYTRTEENPAIYHLQDATNLGASLLARHKDPKLVVAYTVSGFSTLVIGEKVSVNSTDLSIGTVDYVVTDHSYDSKTGLTTITLILKQTILQVPTLFVDTFHIIQSRVKHATRHTSFDPLHSEDW